MIKTYVIDVEERLFVFDAGMKYHQENYLELMDYSWLSCACSKKGQIEGIFMSRS